VQDHFSDDRNMAPQQHECLALLCLLASGASVLADSLQSNSFTFTTWKGPPLTVFFWEPQQSCQQLLFVIHGAWVPSRNLKVLSHFLL